ncbi:MAG: hypothetical protein H8E66_03320 [Planctomycetes bacterium]|nr:hypothetical protein [Planctomycetota bacterium]
MKCLAVQAPFVPPLSLVFACVFWTCGSLYAQPGASDNSPQPRAESGDIIRESDLKIRLEDENGKLVAIPGFTLEVFRELLALESRIKEQLAALPKAVFTGSIEVDGRVDPEQNFASLQAVYRVRLTPRAGVEEATWTAIPLRMDDSFVDVGAIEHDEEGEIYVTRDDSSYLCWLRAAPDTNHTIRVPIKVPVRRSGAQASLDLVLPNMATTMRLSVAEDKIEASSPNGRSNVSSESKNGETIITVAGGGGEIDIVWQQVGQAAPHALEATSATAVHVHGNHIWSEAQLKVRSRSEPIDSFIVQLPEGMKLTSHSDAEFQISRLPSADENEPQHVLVKRLAGATQKLIDVHIEAEFPPVTVDKQRRLLQLSGFSVQDSVREWGSVDVTLDGSWLPTWQIGQFVQRVAVPEDTTGQKPVVARFIYDRQPYSLGLELRPKQTPVSLEATYVVDVASDHVQLDAYITYATNGAKVEALSFKMSDWTIDAVTPVDSLAKPFTFNEGTLTLPIAADATEFEFHVRAKRDIDIDATDVSFELPRPDDPAPLPNASVIVIAHDNVELTTDVATVKWLTQETRPPSVEVPERAASPLRFREELSTDSDEPALFAARRRIRPRETSVAVASDVTLDGATVQVRQSFSVTVAYEPIKEVELAIPGNVLDSGTLRVTNEEQLLTVPATPSLAAVDASADVDTVGSEETQVAAAIVTLATPVIGDIQVDLEFEIPLTDLVSADGVRIPLVQPVGVEATENVTNTLTVRSDERMAITLTDELWTLQTDAAPPGNGRQELRVQSMGVTDAALVQTSIVESRTNGSTTVRRVWIQSLLSVDDQRDRVCFQLQSDQPSFQIQLPPTAQLAELRVLVEGKPPIDLVDHGDSSLTVTLAEEQVGRTIGIEMAYFNEKTHGSRFGIALPKIIDAARAERVYWQIALPRNQHLAWLPATLTSELVWQRDQWYWGRRGRLEQEALEELVGATTREPIAFDTNRYLFSSTGSVDSIGFVTVSRLMLLIVTSGSALVVVLPFIYLPSLRRPAVFFIVGVMLIGVAVTYPEHAAILGQAGAIGLGLAIVACVLQRLIGRRPMTSATHRGSVYLPPDSQASAASAHRPEGSSRATTATAPAHLQVAQVEGEP